MYSKETTGYNLFVDISLTVSVQFSPTLRCFHSQFLCWGSM